MEEGLCVSYVAMLIFGPTSVLTLVGLGYILIILSGCSLSYLFEYGMS